MKRMIMLTFVVVAMLVSLGGCYVVPLHDSGVGYDRHWEGRYYNDRGRGHDRHWEGGYYNDRGRGGHEYYRNGRYHDNRN